MKLFNSQKLTLAALFLAGVCGLTPAQAQFTNFTGSYSQNFDAIGATGTALPPGFTSMAISGANSAYTAASPINAAAIIAAAPDTQTLTIWNAGTKATSSGTTTFNIGGWDSVSDRSLGTDPTGTGAQVIQLVMTNQTGGTLSGVTFSYDCKCLTNGSAGTEQTELPGYCFFYCTSAATNVAANWTEVGVAGNAALVGGLPTQNGLCLPNYTQGTTMSSGPVNITFATPLAANGIMYFRWADDNNEASSPDQQISIDNISIATFTPNGPTVSITSPASGVSVGAGNVTLQASTTDVGGIVTNVTYFSGTTLLGNAITSPYTFAWANVSSGSYNLTAVAMDNAGLTATSSVVSITVTNPLVASFTGSFAQNFDTALAGSTTTMPSGFQAMTLPGSHLTYTNGIPIDSNAIVTATGGSAALTVWNFGANVASSGSGLFNIGTWSNSTDRALGTDPTGTAGTVIQLALANNTGSSLPGVTFNYDELVLTNGTTSNGAFTDDGTERLELPGYSFFYSTVGDNNPANWIEVNPLCLTNWVQGLETPSGPVNITFPTPLAPGAVMYFRWADDNCVASSPDQMLAIDNISVASFNPVGPMVSFITPTNTQNYIPNTAITIALNATDIGSTLTSVTLLNGNSPIFAFTSAPYILPLPAGEIPPGSYSLTAVAKDAAGLSATSSVVNVTVAFVPPTISITNPPTGKSFPAPATITLAANAGSVDGSVTNVAYFQGTTLLANTTAPFFFNWANIPAGSYSLTAQATDTHGLTSTSSVVLVTVTNGFGFPVTSLTSPTNNATFLPGSNIPLAANASESSGTITNVEFFANGADIGGAATAPYNFTWLNVPAGNYALTTVAADNSGNQSTSGVVNITVVVPDVPPTVSLTSPTNNNVFNVPATITLSAIAADSDGSVTNLAFYVGATLLTNITTAPYHFNWVAVSSGAFSFTAVATDNNGISTTSSPVNITLNDPNALATLQQIKTIFVIPLENHDLVQASPTGSPQQLLGNPACPYFNSLITPNNPNSVQTAYATHMFSAAINGEHPSEPNYIWSEAGTDFGIRTDNDPSTSSQNIFKNVVHLSGQLTAAGIPWRTYQEDMEYSSSELVSASGSGVAVNPYNGTTQYNYAVKHNPMAFFTDTQFKNDFPLTNFWTDLTNNNIGRYNWVTPDQFNEMHSGLPAGYTYHGVAYTGDQAAIASGDNALSILIPKIMATQAYKDHGVIIIWTDETESTDDTNTTLPYVIISPLAKGNAYASTLPYSHSSDLKTMDEIFGLAFQTNAIPVAELDAQGTAYNAVNGSSAVINDLSDFFVAVSSTALNSSQNSSGFKDNVTFAATVGGSGTPTGTMQFLTNGVAFGSPVALNGGTASLSTVLLPRGTNLITAIYSGDMNNLPSTNSLMQVVTNHPPIAGSAFYTHTAGVSLLINLSQLLTNVTDLDGDPISLVGVGTDGLNLLSTNGATLVNNGTFLLYTNSVTPNVNDGFSYTVTDGQGGTNVGTVAIIPNNNVVGQSNVKLTLSTTNVTANFFGIPGFRYSVDRSTNLMVGLGWVPISTNVAPANGLIRITDGFLDLGIPIPPVPPSVFYRLRYNP